MLAIWSLVPLLFLNPSWTSGSSQFMYCWSLAWRILNITLLACEVSAIVQWFKHYLALHLFGIEMKTDLFQSCGHCWVFQICWHIACSTFTTSSFRIWNSSTGLPSPPLALFVVMLPKFHLTSCSRMSGSRWWSHHCGYLGHEDLFFFFFNFLFFISWRLITLHEDLFCTVLLCNLATSSSYLLLLLGPYHFCPFFVPIFTWNIPLSSLIFLKRSLVFPTLLFSFISLHWSLRKTF